MVEAPGPGSRFADLAAEKIFGVSADKSDCGSLSAIAGL
jgi:hypothetical protein